MSDTRTISIAIPTWNRYEMVLKAIEQVLDDERIAEIVIVDDHSTDGSYEKLYFHFKSVSKVKLFRNPINLDCYANKHRAMEKATSNWCILFDSDNILTPAYLDALYAIPEWKNDTVYQPEWARPHFDFRQYAGLNITWKNAKQYIYENGRVKTGLETALNAMNFFINRGEYLNTWDGDVDPITSDSIYFAYCWLKRCKKYHITKDLQYDHLVHDAHYVTNVHRTGNFHSVLLKRFETMEQDMKVMNLVFDIGANVGETVEIFLKNAHKVVAFEPNPNLHRLLSKKFEGENVIIDKRGIDNKTGTNAFKICDAYSLSTFSEEWKEHSRFSKEHYWDIEIDVPVTTIDNAIDQYGVPDYIKIDVEGYEYEVIKGLTRLLPNTIITFEWAEEQVDNIQRTIQYIASLGYTAFSYTDGDNVLYPADIRWMTLNEIELFVNRQLEKNRMERWGMIYTKQQIMNTDKQISEPVQIVSEIDTNTIYAGYVNLEIRPDRNEKMIEELKRCGFEPIQ